MKCNNCEYRSCEDDDCNACQELFATGLCTVCHKYERCKLCGKNIDLVKSNGYVMTFLFDYFCNKNCYNSYKEVCG
jgi:hypothetical protein